MRPTKKILIFGLLGAVTALPQAIELRNAPAMNEQLLDDFKYYAQHSAASYCNFNTTPGGLVSCPKGCSRLIANNVTVVTSFVGKLAQLGGYVSVDHTRKEIALVLRGSDTLRNFIVDGIIFTVPCTLGDGCRAHAGDAKGWDEVSNTVKQGIRTAVANNPSYRIISTGHSLGGVTATLAAGYLRQDGYAVDLYTYGSVSPGNEALVDYITKQPGKEYRITHLDDVAPRFPPYELGYRHTTPEYWLSGGSWTSTSYGVENIKICEGYANRNCAGSQKGLNLISHLFYFQNMYECAGFALQL